MSLLIEKPGILTTIQDLGRTCYRSMGINPGGAMDTAAVRLINTLLGNPEDEGVIEMHFPAPSIVFEQNAIFALGGAELSAKLDGQPIENWRPFYAAAGSRLQFTGKNLGSRACLSVQGGLKLEKWLGSLSTNRLAGLGGFRGRELKEGDRIFLNKTQEYRKPPAVRVSTSLIPRYSRFPTVRAIAGAEFDHLTALGEALFLNENFVVSTESDRMGFRLTGKPLHLASDLELVSSATAFGTIQLLPGGQLVVLMADHQVSGGYPRLANVISSDLPLLGQLSPGDKIGFHLVSTEEAEDALAGFEHDLCLLSTGSHFLWR